MSTTGTQGSLFGDTPEPVRMLTVQQPMAWAIIHAGKDVENRKQYTSFRGTLVIHAGQTVNAEYAAKLEALGISIPAEALRGGHIVGTVHLTDCTRNASSPWATPGAWHNILTDPMPATREVRARGQLSLVNPPEGWEAAFTA